MCLGISIINYSVASLAVIVTTSHSFQLGKPSMAELGLHKYSCLRDCLKRSIELLNSVHILISWTEEEEEEKEATIMC